MPDLFSVVVARPVAERIASQLSECCDRVEIAGSLRRCKRYVGDIELLVIPKATLLFDVFEIQLQSLISQGVLDYRFNCRGSRVYGAKNKLLVHVPSGIGVDIFSTDMMCWPVSLVVRTGGKITNQRISMAAIKRGMRFHAYGSGFTMPDGTYYVCETEEDVFNAVGLPYLQPCERP